MFVSSLACEKFPSVNSCFAPMCYQRALCRAMPPSIQHWRHPSLKCLHPDLTDDCSCFAPETPRRWACPRSSRGNHDKHCENRQYHKRLVVLPVLAMFVVVASARSGSALQQAAARRAVQAQVRGAGSTATTSSSSSSRSRSRIKRKHTIPAIGTNATGVDSLPNS